MASSNAEMSGEMKYKGVRKRKWGKWVSEIRLPNSRDRIWLGSYDSPEKAARAFDAALFCLRGDRAHFNFPDTPFLFHLPPDHHHHSLSPHQIQLLASTFANQLQSSASVLDDTTSSSSSSAPLDHSDDAVEEGHGHGHGIDWSFLNTLDSNDDVVAAASDYALYDYEDHFGEFQLQMQCPTSPPPVYHNALEYQPDDPFSHHSFLWNFGHDSL